MVGKKKGWEAVILSLLEKKTENYLAIRIRNKTSQTVMEAMQALCAEFGDGFSKVFKTITVDNGSEFSDLAKLEAWGRACFSPTLIPLGNTPKMNGTTVCSVHSFQRVCPLSDTATKTSSPPLMN